MRKCPVGEHEPSSVPPVVQQAFRERVNDWATNADYPWQTREVFGGYFPKGLNGPYKKPTIYLCPETLSVKSSKKPEFGGEWVDTAYFQFDPNQEGMFRPESALTILKGRFGNTIHKLMLVSDLGGGEMALAQSLDIRLGGITQVDAHYDGIRKAGRLINYHLELAYYVPYNQPDQPEDPAQTLKISDLLASDREVRFHNRFEVDEAVIDGANLQLLMSGNNVDNYYGSWTTVDGKVRFRPKGEDAWYLEPHFPKSLSQDLARSLVGRRTERYPLTAFHSFDRSWRETQVFSGIGIKAGYNDREDPEFYRFPFL